VEKPESLHDWEDVGLAPGGQRGSEYYRGEMTGDGWSKEKEDEVLSDRAR